MSSHRSRFRLENRRISAVLEPWATSPGWFRYHESGKHKVDPDMLMRFGALFQDLAKLQPNLAFTQSSMTWACKDIMNQKNVVWKLDKSQQKEQPATMARRLRSACRHVQQAMIKTKKPRWVVDMMQLDPADIDANTRDDDEDVEQNAMVAAAECDDIAFPFFGFDHEHMKAWRSKTSSGARELTANVKEPKEAKLTDFMMAEFHDGVYELTDMTVAEWRGKQSASSTCQASKKKPAKVLWEALHVASGLMLTVKPRADRQQLVSLYWGTQQKCQVPLNAFDDEHAAAMFLKVAPEVTFSKTG